MEAPALQDAPIMLAGSRVKTTAQNLRIAHNKAKAESFSCGGSAISSTTSRAQLGRDSGRTTVVARHGVD
jgi:hypothetical protein